MVKGDGTRVPLVLDLLVWANALREKIITSPKMEKEWKNSSRSTYPYHVCIPRTPAFLYIYYCFYIYIIVYIYILLLLLLLFVDGIRDVVYDIHTPDIYTLIPRILIPSFPGYLYPRTRIFIPLYPEH